MSEAAPIQSALSFADEAEGIAFFLKLGRDCAAKVAGLAGEMEGHFAKLERYEDEYAGDFDHRLAGAATDRDVRGAVKESIFQQSNISLNIPRGQCRYLTAKSTEDLLGSRPWLAASGLGPEDAELASDAERYLEWKLSQPEAGFETSVADALLSAWIYGYAVLKTTHRRLERRWEEVVRCLVDPATGEPVALADGGYITADEKPEWNAEREGWIFPRDARQEFVFPDGAPMEFKPHAVRRAEVTFEGAVISSPSTASPSGTSTRSTR